MWMRLCMVHPDISQFPASHIILAPLIDSAKKPSLSGLRGDFGSAHLVDFPRCSPHCQSQRTLSWCNKDACCCHTYQSISTNIWAAGLPSSMAKMLPACGSPWKRPNSKSWRKAACSFTCGASIHLPTLTARHSVYKAMDKTTHRSLHPFRMNSLMSIPRRLAQQAQQGCSDPSTKHDFLLPQASKVCALQSINPPWTRWGSNDYSIDLLQSSITQGLDSIVMTLQRKRKTRNSKHCWVFQLCDVEKICEYTVWHTEDIMSFNDAWSFHQLLRCKPFY